MDLNISPQAAATAARQILGYYPTIPASDPQAFAAGLVKMLSTFPAPVIARAVDPVKGIAAKVTFLNLAAIRALLDTWLDEHLTRQAMIERANRKPLPAPIVDPEAQARIAKGLKELSEHIKAGFSPASIGASTAIGISAKIPFRA